MNVITYSLCKDKEVSNEYYSDISGFTNKVINEIPRFTGILLEDFKGFISQNKIEDLRSDLEYKIEILTLGVFWINYISESVMLKRISKDALIKLSSLREKNNMKKVADFLRGVLGTLFLTKEEREEEKFTLENLTKLLGYLSATGEFKQEVKRLKTWERYLNNKSQREVNNVLLSLVNLGKWFQDRAIEGLGRYTLNVEGFVKKAHMKYKWREDYVFCRRGRVEYHLNMVGAEMMNRAFREDFLRTKNKWLLLPACMRLNPNMCSSEKTKNGYLCKGCTVGCKVREYTQLGEKYDFKVYIIHHESSAFKEEVAEEGKVGIIGVACVLNLISGGWKAKDMGFIPQCVLLDYCGCKQHWDDKGIVTSINTLMLLHTIGK